MMGWHGLSGALSVTSYHTHGHACGESVPPSTGHNYSPEVGHSCLTLGVCAGPKVFALSF